MKRNYLLILLLFVFSSLASAQTIDEKLREIDEYAQAVLRTHGGPGMAVA